MIYHGPVENSVAAIENCGASAVVIPADGLFDGCGGEIIWKVSSAVPVQEVLEKTGEQADVFWLDDVIIDDMVM